MTAAGYSMNPAISVRDAGWYACGGGVEVAALNRVDATGCK